MSNTGDNAELVKRFEAAVKANGYRTCDDNTEREYIDAKSALTTALAAADARIGELDAALFHAQTSRGYHDKRANDAETLLEEAWRALAPFIRLADNVFSDGKNATVADEVTLWCFNDTDITFGDLRRARATHDRIGE